MNNTPTPRTDAESFLSRGMGIVPTLPKEVVPIAFSRTLERELTAVTEQRDGYKAALQSADNHNHEIATKLEIVTEQRDRLAEAIRKHKTALRFAPDFCDVELYEALAAVKGGSDE